MSSNIYTLWNNLIPFFTCGKWSCIRAKTVYIQWQYKRHVLKIISNGNGYEIFIEKNKLASLNNDKQVYDWLKNLRKLFFYKNVVDFFC